MAALTIKRIVDVLRKVPEKKFCITELAPRLLDVDGKVDIVKAMNVQGDLNLAIAEVQFYVHATKAVNKTLTYLNSSRDPDEVDFGDIADENDADEEFNR